MANAVIQGIAVAKAAGACFVRANQWANEGFVQGESAKALRNRSSLYADDVKIFADVAIATGNRTGDATSLEEIEAIRSGTVLPVIIGSGLTVDNAKRLMAAADGAIVGSSVKVDGVWWQPVCPNRTGL